MERDYEDLAIDNRGDDYVLIRIDGEGRRSELVLSENNVIFLGRLGPTVARRIVASKTHGGVSAMVAPAKDFSINSDLHRDLVLLRIRDEHEGEFDVSFAAAGARHLGERLIAWAEKVERAEKPTKQ
jgi:hypothetical protein